MRQRTHGAPTARTIIGESGSWRGIGERGRSDRLSRRQIDVRAEGLIFKSGSSPEHRVFTEATARGLPQGGPFCLQHSRLIFFRPVYLVCFFPK
jgi:hypothetical protein